MKLSQLLTIAVAATATAAPAAHAITIQDLTIIEERGVSPEEMAKGLTVLAASINYPNSITAGNYPNTYLNGNNPYSVNSGSRPNVLTSGTQPNVYTRGAFSEGDDSVPIPLPNMNL